MEKIQFLSEGVSLHGCLYPLNNGKASAVIFCHDAFESHDNWSAYAEKLSAKGFACFSFDFIGHGESQGLRSQVDLRLWAYNIRDSMNWLKKQGYNRFALVGWGHGGSAALLAAAHDSRVKCVITLAAPVLIMPSLAERIAYGAVSLAAWIKKTILRKPLTLSRLNEMEELSMFADDELNSRYFTDPKVQQVYRAIPIPESLDSVWVDITHALVNVRVPVLILHGSEDQIIPPAQSQKLYDLLQGKKSIQMIAGSGHALHLDRESNTVYQAISDWLKRNFKS